MSQQSLFDDAVIGSGLTGLTIAVALSQKNKNIALIEGADTFGGFTRRISFPTGQIDNGLRHIPVTANTQNAIESLEEILQIKLIRGIVSAPPVTFENGELRSFVGFGDKSPEFYDLIAPLFVEHYFDFHIPVGEWPQLLMSKFQGTFLPKSYVTRVQSENNTATQVLINGTKTLRAKRFTYTGQIKNLAVILGDILSPRAKQKLTKNSYWTAVCLDLCHGQNVTDSRSLHLLNGTTEDELGPCVGRFMETTESNQNKMQTSQWMTYIDEEATEESELVAHALKKIKRQIKRAYPTALEGLLRERIFVASMLSGTGDLKLQADGRLPDLENFWIASTALSQSTGTTASLLQAKLTLASLVGREAYTEATM